MSKQISETAPAIGAPDAAPASNVGRGIAIAAALIMVGNLASRIFGLIRETVINGQFGVTNDVAVYRILSAVPTQIYDFLIGGLVNRHRLLWSSCST